MAVMDSFSAPSFAMLCEPSFHTDVSCRATLRQERAGRAASQAHGSSQHGFMFYRDASTGSCPYLDLIFFVLWSRRCRLLAHCFQRMRRMMFPFRQPVLRPR